VTHTTKHINRRSRSCSVHPADVPRRSARNRGETRIYGPCDRIRPGFGGFHLPPAAAGNSTLGVT